MSYDGGPITTLAVDPERHLYSGVGLDPDQWGQSRRVHALGDLAARPAQGTVQPLNGSSFTKSMRYADRQGLNRALPAGRDQAYPIVGLVSLEQIFEGHWAALVRTPCE